MHRAGKHALLGAVLVLAGGAASGQSALGLNDIYLAAIKHDATLRAAGAQVAAVQELVEQSRSQLKPNVSYNFNYFRNDLHRKNSLDGREISNTNELYNSSGHTLHCVSRCIAPP